MTDELKPRYPKKNTAAWRLFHYTYPVWYPQLFKYDKSYIEKRGIAITGDAELDRLRLDEDGLFNQTPAGMALLMEDGCPIFAESFFSYEDIPYVYHDIQEHLMDWERRINRGIHINEIPDLYDFRILENLALELHDYAMYLSPQNQSSGVGIVDRLNRLNSVRSSIHRTMPLSARTNEVVEIRPYVSIADRIEKSALGGNVWR
mgnify:CR=1 FL=1|tara:strand:+ start:1039 stop:1650 length:612 start_codon:yes stop_codon:yes gene_type:complete